MALVDDLADSADLPVEALRRAVRTPGQVAAGVIRAVERAATGEDLAERDANLAFWGIHVLAQARDTRVFAPLLALLRRPAEIVEPLLGDALTTTLSRVLASTYDGDAAALAAALLDPATDEYGRWALFDALTTLVVTGAVVRDVARDVARRFDETRPSPAGEPGWIGWAELVATLGFDDLAPRVEEAFAAGRLLDDLVDPDWFAGTRQAASAGPLTLYDLDPLQFGFVEDAVAELEEALAGDEDETGEPEEPVVNPLRHVGRNDPCPCGSRRKFKQCCLGKDAAAAAVSPSPSALPPLPPLRGR